MDSNLTNPTPVQSTQDKMKTRLWKFLKPLLSIGGFVAVVVVTAMLINMFVFQTYFVDGTSMTPTLQNNDRLIIEKLGRTWATVTNHPYVPKRGDIVVLHSSLLDDAGQKEQLIKRVIGLPGDVVSITDGKVVVINAAHPNGLDVDQELGLSLAPTFAPDNPTVTVGENEVYVLGDNRAQGGSYDSRAFGMVPIGKIEGRLWARVLPITKSNIF